MIVRTARLHKAELLRIPFCTVVVYLLAVAAVVDLHGVYPLRQKLYFMDIPVRLSERVSMDQYSPCLMYLVGKLIKAYIADVIVFKQPLLTHAVGKQICSEI